MSPLSNYQGRMRPPRSSISTAARTLLGAALFCLTGCFGMPNPLAPALDGSVGVPHRGVLTHGTALPKKGPGFVRLRKNDIRWGNPRLVGAIQRAAKNVADSRPGAPLVVADLSAKRGGKIPRHRSHRNGRDGDLLFYALTPGGRSIKSPGFVHFKSDGIAEADKGEMVRFDVARNWRLVRSLVADETAAMQYIFVARWLEALLIEYALATEADLELVWRAEVVLRQPGDSAPHDDHFHVRLYCSRADREAGCIDTGPIWQHEKKSYKYSGPERYEPTVTKALLSRPLFFLHG